MAQSLANVLLHIVFSTKDRMPLIGADVATELYRYLAKVGRDHGCPIHGINGTANHIHMACSLARTVTISALVENLKTDSSKWMKTKQPRAVRFAWQSGYAVFSIGQSQLDSLCKYIARQPQHHQRRGFEDELRALFAKYGVAYDERYVWD